MEISRLKEIRVKTGLTLRELSKYTKIDYSYLAKIEKNQKRLTQEMAVKLSSFFSVSKSYFEGNDYYQVTCFTNDLKRTFQLDEMDIQKYGNCYTNRISVDLNVVHIINENIEKQILKEKEETSKLLKKLINEKEIIDSMDNWSVINLLLAQTKIDYLLKKKR